MLSNLRPLKLPSFRQADFHFLSRTKEFVSASFFENQSIGYRLWKDLDEIRTYFLYSY